MAANGNFLKLCNMMGSYRNLLSSRIILPNYQPAATFKQSIEEIAGLPSKPKKPLAPYIKFVKDLRPRVLKENPNYNMIDVTKVIAEEWRKVDQNVKIKMKAEYDEVAAVYQQAKAEYYKSLTQEQHQNLEKAKLERKHIKEKRVIQKAMLKLGKPKRPPSAFVLWTRTLDLKRGSRDLGDWVKEMASKWADLPEKEKLIFLHRAAEAAKKYRVEVSEWRERVEKDSDSNLQKYSVKPNPVITEKKDHPQ